MPKTALVTGAARGLGRAIAADLARDHQVAITWRSTDPAALLAHHPDIFAIEADLTDPAGIQRLPAQVIERFGQLDLIVNNAGHVAPDDMERFDPAASLQTFATNVTGPMSLIAAALPFLGSGAAIVNITSQNARLPAMSAHSYSASKAALETATRIAAKTLGPRGIRVNAVAPGAVNTPEAPRPQDLTDIFLNDTALGALATPEDIAAAVRFLASDAARAITGETLTVSAGYRL